MPWKRSRQQVGDGEVLVRRVAPGLAADMQVHPLGGGLGQAVGEGLQEQVAVGVVRDCRVLMHGGGKHSHRVRHARGERAHEVAQAEQGRAVGVGRLLPQEGEEGGAFQQEVVPVGIGPAEAVQAPHV